MTRYRLSWLLVTLASGVVLATACGGDDDDATSGTAGSAGRGGSTVTGSGGTGGSGGSSGTGGTAGKAGGTSKDGGSTRIPCGETTCPATQQCDTGPMGPRCVACLNDTQCATNMQNPPRLHCDPAAGACRSCLNDTHCTAPQRCIISTTMGNNTCQVRCASDADCATQTNNRACNVTTMMCVQCQNNTHCAGNAGGPVCVGTTCEQCGADTDCVAPGLPICDATNNTCVQCRDNTQCAEPTPTCVLTGANTCRECGANADCTGRPGGGACVMNMCRQCSPGANGIPCPAGNRCVMNVCEPIPEAGPPEAGREGGSDASEGGAETGTDAVSDAPADVAADG
ncbi:MAG TPA: hypothetical protein VK550_28945 [Polyangiaceae bacterium]|nr:hypothetical protein [Polyangiaceae bacterium]